MKTQTIRGLREGAHGYIVCKTVQERFGRQVGSRGGREHRQESMSLLYKLTEVRLFYPIIIQYLYLSLRNATLNHAKSGEEGWLADESMES